MRLLKNLLRLMITPMTVSRSAAIKQFEKLGVPVTDSTINVSSSVVVAIAQFLHILLP